MAQATAVERLLRRDRALLAAAMGALFVLSALYTVLGVGMEMSALEMTGAPGMAGMPEMAQGQAAMPEMQAPGGWSLSHAVLVFLMWWMMMIAMMLPGAAPVVLLHGALMRQAGPGSAAVPAAFLSGYLAAWAGFSLAAAAAQWAAQSAGLVSGAMVLTGQAHPPRPRSRRAAPSRSAPPAALSGPAGRGPRPAVPAMFHGRFFLPNL
ncbi:copper chaperone [Mangrovicoccus ximenensis]|uniref:copper chaperone n=1 Tax=Mangrovicoccus ximenensis TaxID=1911570 RepID=UPI001F315F2D|nr:DUF2182 domain-containing protein [Mangrovicoccus ximenensis]